MTTKDEARIHAMMAEHWRAIHDKNARAALAHDAGDIVVFGLGPPLRLSGAAASDPRELKRRLRPGARRSTYRCAISIWR